MWVFDGEEWTQDNGSDQVTANKPETVRPRYEQMMPELQVIEIVPVVPRNTNVPPLPMP
ncbi:MAG TPA: hypothetical protein VF846_05385 [Thermoanaerobaculia bacterium]|jgi:hypothetical protein|nr:hypothetical protein [Thermoanaerobaculia bacterium]